ncbi:helicase-related protein [Gloeocapsopsis dulcis]|uniref:Helicase n=1 Tax=Gloeocapsopsis dulcis AAB1 = 1H9 TaxID=1433147 RepID=A0A6N8G254_9CHRO|nr:helicase-related protein [Gloeocapsopsis dulcis]MUL39488.1 hypothetical protein [Gloeocapsopsis dulcis AAB1 = 1H9]WNN89710.1 helicase-related protein [Gloeocapsopsis dulcis]
MPPFDSLPDVWFEPLVTFEHIKQSFSQGEQEIRIATGFFTIAGWNLIRSHVRKKKVYLLVGIVEPSEGQARDMLVAEIIKDLSKGLGDNRRQAVIELVQRLELKLFGVVDARSTKHHGKLYLVDRNLAIFSSANTTYNGFINQNESGNIVKDKSKVEYLVDCFDLYFSQANDISEELLQALKRWLRLVVPWDIYLKTMLCLEDIKPTQRQYKEPASFQRDIIARVLRNIKNHRGSFLVASTGLGKTVLATYVALQLFEAKEIDRVMVVAPKQVQKMWKDELGLACLSGELFTYFTLFQTDSDRDGSLDDFEDIAENLFNDKWLLVLDESHILRNRFHRGEQQTTFNRLLPLIKGSSCKVIAMTGSPLSRDVENVNSQLLLLPHTASPNVLLPDLFEDSRGWSIDNVDELRNFPVASLMSMPHVAKNYGRTDERGLYIMYGQQKRYIPEVVLHRVDYSLMLEDEITHLFREGYLEGREDITRSSIEKEVRIAWASSPKVLEETLAKVVDTPGELGYDNFTFRRTPTERKRAIVPILKKLATIAFLADIKIQALKNIVEEEFIKGRKIIIFCERLATAVYLENGLNASLPTVRIFATVEKRQAYKYDFKRDQEITNGLLGFAPESNAGHKKEKSDRPQTKKRSLPTYDILITTDAFGVGINLQDASVVINYDTAWTPISPIQRAGRVLRPWKDPRTVQIYTFVPHLVNSTDELVKLDKIAWRWDNLKNRHDESLRIIELPVLPDEETRQIYMPDVASTVSIRSVPLDIEEISDIDVSSFFMHTSKLQQDRERAIALPDDITSAIIYGGKYHAIYLLMRISDEYKWTIYNIDKRKLEDSTDIELLNLIQCTEDTPTALVDPDKIEDCTTTAIQMWCDRHKVNYESVFRICTLYLHPGGEVQTNLFG